MSEATREVAAVAGDVAAHPTISLLSLPDDLLLTIYEQVYEQVYEERCENTATDGAPRVAEILVNKRLFRLARPLWFSRLKITKAQLDCRLSGLLEHEIRRQHLQRLDLPLSPGYALLTKLTVARLPHLTHLSVTSSKGGNELVHATLEGIIASTRTLRHLTTRCHGYSDEGFDQLEHRLGKIRPPSLRSRTSYDDSKLLFRNSYAARTVGTHLSDVNVRVYRSLKWNKLEFLRCGPKSTGTGGPVRVLLGGLDAALEKDKDAAIQRFPLRHLALDLHPNMGWKQGEDETSAHFDTFFRLLPFTRVETLEFTSATKIPNVHPAGQFPSVKLLKVSGSCTFCDKAQLKVFKRLVSSLSGLVQLHLIGDKFFDPLGTSANAISELGEIDQCVQYTELYTLLFVLARTKVKVFTYRAAGERREMRWTRMDEKEDFERECWTL